MGQHASSESVHHSRYPEITTLTPRGPPGHDVASEDETMVDVSSASSMVSGRTRSSLQRRLSVPRLPSPRTHPPPPPPLTAPSSGRPARRSSLWCRVQQSLRNRIYRTTRNGNVTLAENTSDRQPPVPRRASSNPLLSRRHTLRNSLLLSNSNTNRRSSIFGAPPPSQTASRPLSYISPDPFVDNIDPRFEFSEDRPRASSISRTAEPRRRSIWGQPSHLPSPPSPPRTIVSTSPTPFTTLPSVIDHSTQTSGVNPNGHPFNITRRPGEDQAEMLSRFLYVAGAALAASLVGSTDTTTAQLQDFSADFADARDDSPDTVPIEGSFEGFLRALRQGRTQFAHALRNDSETSSNGESSSAFTYLLMYRFNSRNTTTSAVGSPTSETIPEESDNSMAVESRPPTPIPSSSSSSTRSTRSETPSNPSEPRMVPFVIIGVQPVPPRETGHTGVPSFSEGVASLLANARQNAGATRPGIRPTTSSGSVNSEITPLQTSASIPAIPGAWRDSPPPTASSTDSRRRRASVDGSYRHSEGVQSRERESNTRAWQMYIYGGAYPENHLIFTAPTLFTEVPLPLPNCLSSPCLHPPFHLFLSQHPLLYPSRGRSDH
jgi:hypothetical protein